MGKYGKNKIKTKPILELTSDDMIEQIVKREIRDGFLRVIRYRHEYLWGQVLDVTPCADGKTVKVRTPYAVTEYAGSAHMRYAPMAQAHS